MTSLFSYSLQFKEYTSRFALKCQTLNADHITPLCIIGYEAGVPFPYYPNRPLGSNGPSL